ncbi:FtsX-like permease family protein [Ferruginibacter sp.]|uniref:FtsX-like permease family protein n=1 Tax=Ferruginibacter sp. TaxID=1940288 RepID=UPI0019C7273F|nr:FtsX-like permease family protein [Ferruginibacter sp.]MBC7629390.1 ABC transporter permease [Ferruginibacter sp.]
MYLTFAWRYFKAKKSANAINIISWVTVGVITFAIACQILVLSVFNGFEGLVKSLYGSFYADIKIIPARGKTFTLTSTQLALIKQQPGISAISLIAEEKALLQNEDIQTIVYLKGVDNNYTNVSGVAAKTYLGNFNTGTAAEPGLIVGAGIQNAAAISVDAAFKASSLTLILPKKGKVTANDPMQSLSEGIVKATGVFTIQQDFDNKYAFTNIDFVKQQMGFSAEEYSATEIKINSKSSPVAIQMQLSNLLGSAYTIQSKYQQNASLYNTMRMEKWIIYAVLTLILFIAAFNMVSALTMLVMEKQKDISVLQSMGADKSMILKIFLSEGLLLAGIGTVMGIILALIICFLQVNFKLIKLEGGSFLIDYFPVQLQLTDFILVAMTATFIAFLASWFPALKASKQAIELR